MIIAGRKVPIVVVVSGPLMGAAILVGACPFSGGWAEASWFVLLPYVLYGVAAILGAGFTQTRILFGAVVVAWPLFLVDHYVFAMHDAGRGQSVMAAATVLIPCVTAAFYCLPERGIFTPHGAIRVAVLSVLLGITSIIPLTGAFSSVVDGSLSIYGGASLRIPGIGVLALMGSIPVLLYRKKGESPILGGILLSALLFVFVGMSFLSPLWPAGQQRTVLLLFSACGALMLIWAVLESSWRHMNMDELTELPSRRALKHHLRCLGGAYVIGVVDVDHFKRINDVYGHLVGDQVLRFLASQLLDSAKGKVYRYGGEEFVVIYERCDYKDALNNLDDVRDAVSRKAFALRGADRPSRKPRKQEGAGGGRSAESITITVSVGAASSTAGGVPQEVLDAADQALYQAKESGRNRVCHVTR